MLSDSGVPRSDDKAWYNEFYRESPNSELIVPAEIRDRYDQLPHPALHRLETWHRLIGNIAGKKILFVGCGVESSPVMLALRGGEIWVLDLAEEAIKKQKALALANETEARTHFLVGSCEQLPVPGGMFDLVVGIGILHHLQADLEKTCLEVTRVLNKDGFAVFEEPVALSRVIKGLRDLLPIPRLRDASPICRPLDERAMACLARYFSLEPYYFAFLARFDRFLYACQPGEFAPWWKNSISMTLHLIDYFLLGIPRLKRQLASQIVMKMMPA